MAAIFILNASNSLSQTNRTWDIFVSFQGNATAYDRTVNNNYAGLGLGLQTIIGKSPKIRAIVEVNGDLFAGTKMLYVTADEKPIKGKTAVLGFYGGALLQVTPYLFVAGAVGTSIYNSRAHLGLRPSIGLFPFGNRKWLIRTSFTNVLQRDEISNASFGYLSFSVALKLR